ncbi:MAG: hypothetical protein GC166_04445 [Alphaproteobacteria bacterium]|nr:hypothetical protein [Alphaproteobacteria bacterium]
MLRKACDLLAVVLLTVVPLWAAAPAVARPLPHVFLIQNSGWMEPFLTDHRSEKFDLAIRAFIARTSPADAPIVVASFNKSGDIPGRQSPNIVYRGPNTPSAVAGAIARVDLPRRKDGRLANSDYSEALLATIKDVLQTGTGVIFMITNNKSAPNGREQPEDGPVAVRTEAFNELLKTSDAISRIVAWPLRFPAHGKLFDERGLVIYGIAYGGSASEPLRSESEAAPLQKLLSDPPVQLKPLGINPLVLRLAAGRRGDLSWYADRNGNLAVEGLSSDGDTVDMVGALSSNLYPYVIKTARIEGSWTPAANSTAHTKVSIAPETINDLAPMSSVANVRIKIALSGAQRQTWLQDKRNLPGTLSIRLVDLELGLSPAFSRKMAGLFGSGAAPRPDVPDILPPQVPRIFVNYKAVNQATTTVPLTLGVSYFPWPLIGLIGALVAAAGLVGGGVWFAMHARPFNISIDGEPRTIALRPFQHKEVQGLNGTYIVSRGPFGPPAVKPKAA